MSRKVLIISSSPRIGGNSDILCDCFAKGATEAGNPVEIVSLAEKKIGFCHACYVCQSGNCPQKDDVPEIVDKLKAADVIVLATPVYFYSVCAQLKALIDRSVMAYPGLKNKHFYFIMTMADTDRDNFSGTLGTLRGFLECCQDSSECGVIGACGFYEKGTIAGSTYCKQAYEMGKGV